MEKVSNFVQREKSMTYKVVKQKWSTDKKDTGYEQGWVCEHCGASTTTVYIPTSHDHTDESVNMCTCGQGQRFQDVWPTLTKNIYPNHPMEWYRRYFS
jgi:hypothetical protein